MKKLSNTDIIIKLQKELFGERWHNSSAEELTQTLESFQIESKEASISDEDDREIKSWNSFINSSQVTLMERGKKQRLINSEKFHIVKMYIKKETNIK